jgi:hypothetical protein
MQKHRSRRFAVLVLLALAAIGWALFDYFSAHNAEIPAQNQAVLSEAKIQNLDSVVMASEALGRLAVKAATSREGYSREQFSKGWSELNGCDLRNLILKRDLQQAKLDSDNCTVLAGVLSEDPYTGQTINFQRGRDTSSAVQIDHVVALADAWVKGAQQLTPDRRRQFANDPLNLLAADGPANMQKGASDASQWLPRPAFSCRYVARQIAVKLQYQLWVTQTEHNAMKRTLGNCPDQVLPLESQ